jgi:hypothetical protein
MTVDIHIIEYSKKNTKKETYLYNNRLYWGLIPKTEKVKNQYNINHKWISENM